MSRRRKRKRKPSGVNGTKVKPKIKTAVMAKTENGRTIQKLLIQNGQDPRLYKDWVVILANRMLEWMGSYDIRRADTGEALKHIRTFLVHKRELHKFIGKKIASQWWNHGINRRVAQKGPQNEQV